MTDQKTTLLEDLKALFQRIADGESPSKKVLPSGESADEWLKEEQLQNAHARQLAHSGVQKIEHVDSNLKGHADLVGRTFEHLYDDTKHMALDLRQIADNTDQATGYKTADANTLRIAAAFFDGLPTETTFEAARQAYADSLDQSWRAAPTP